MLGQTADLLRKFNNRSKPVKFSFIGRQVKVLLLESYSLIDTLIYKGETKRDSFYHAVFEERARLLRNLTQHWLSSQVRPAPSPFARKRASLTLPSVVCIGTDSIWREGVGDPFNRALRLDVAVLHALPNFSDAYASGHDGTTRLVAVGNCY